MGIYGWKSWQQVEHGPGRTASALDELMVDCYSFIFLKRFERLKAQARVKPEIDGLVFLYIRNFIHDRRKAHDPVGFRIFETLRSAIRQAVQSGEIFVASGDPKIRSNTMLAFESGEIGSKPHLDLPDLDLPHLDLETVVKRWYDGLLPGIITAAGEERQKCIDRLRRRVLALKASGARLIRFQDLADPFKRDIRARWAALLEQEGGESVREESEGLTSVVRLIYPDEHVETRDSFRKLNARMANRLERIEVPSKTRRYLQQLWGFLGTYACDVDMETLPSNRKVSTHLQIPRERLPGLYQTLGEMIR